MAIVTALLAVPWWTLLGAGAQWPSVVDVGGTLAFVSTGVSLPILLYFGYADRHLDGAARVGSFLLGAAWVLFSWSILGNVLRLFLSLTGMADPTRSRVVAGCVVACVSVLLLWGVFEAMRVPRIVSTEVTLPTLEHGLDGTRVVLLSDLHYGAIDRTGWSSKVAAAVNALDADIVCLTGDIADGTVHERREQAEPLGAIRAKMARVYVTGNHEYGGHAQGWLDHLRDLGWNPLHNEHLVVGRGSSQMVLAGIDDTTAALSGCPGHGADIDAALAGVDRSLPVVLLAHQPKDVDSAVAEGVDLQLSGHTHGGQIWPFHHLVRLDQPTLHGLSRHGEKTQLYTSRGTGFWGPPLRIFAPSEISVLILRSGDRIVGAV